MKTLKFRVWEKQDKKMYIMGKHDVWYNIMTFTKDGRCLIPSAKTGDWLIPMQFTGLQDKNGKDIYEGDILQYKYYFASRRWWSTTDEIPEMEANMKKQKNDVKVLTKKVEFKDGVFTLGYNMELYKLLLIGEYSEKGSHSNGEWESKIWDIEVIGNIHENKELS